MQCVNISGGQVACALSGHGIFWYFVYSVNSTVMVMVSVFVLMKSTKVDIAFILDLF